MLFNVDVFNALDLFKLDVINTDALTARKANRCFGPVAICILSNLFSRALNGFVDIRLFVD